MAKNKLRNFSNCSFFNESVDSLPFPNNSQDFGYSLGVIHHIPDMQEAINCCVKKLKTGAPFLIYCYYSFDNRPFWYRWLWLITNFFRVIISRTPSKIRYLISQAFALCVYLPIAKSIKLLKKMGFDLQTLPLYFYHDKSFYTMRTDALDRFGTRLEHRLSRLELEDLMKFAGLENISFSENAPFWCAVGYKRCTEHI